MRFKSCIKQHQIRILEDIIFLITLYEKCRCIMLQFTPEKLTQFQSKSHIHFDIFSWYYFPCKDKLVFAHTNIKGCVNMENRLQELRWKKNWSQNQLSIKSGVPQSVISTIENNMFENPGVFTAIRLSHALSVTVEDIFIL